MNGLASMGILGVNEKRRLGFHVCGKVLCSGERIREHVAMGMAWQTPAFVRICHAHFPSETMVS